MTITETRAETRKRAEWIREHTEGGAPEPRMLLPVADMLALLDGLDDADAAVARVRALHRTETVDTIHGGCANENCEHEDACPVTGQDDICAHCTSDSDYEDGVPVWMPCPTLAALDGEESADEEAHALRFDVATQPSLGDRNETIEEHDIDDEEEQFMDHTERMDLYLQNGGDRG